MAIITPLRLMAGVKVIALNNSFKNNSQSISLSLIYYVSPISMLHHFSRDSSLLDILGERVMGHLRNNTIKTHHSQLGDTSRAFGPKRPNQNSPTLALLHLYK
ncbi:hypothetical protein CEXT_28361 [Caerostris extrusa]|uniref:Uncharacterized protein n=1 Tax=Caerostris extrusa TaxID=172846 RepID=A0AAV4TJT3_CAEEX|nr:hypothetical protein CEXT_28361 [Caerostris extrusa]